jgi:hypothetical protein
MVRSVIPTGMLHLILSDEVFIIPAAWHQAVVAGYDQNRLFIGAQIPLGRVFVQKLGTKTCTIVEIQRVTLSLFHLFINHREHHATGEAAVGNHDLVTSIVVFLLALSLGLDIEVASRAHWGMLHS